MSYSFEEDENLLELLKEEGVREVSLKYIAAMKKLMYLEEIVAESESDTHWTDRVEWLVDDADDMIRDFKSYAEVD